MKVICKKSVRGFIKNKRYECEQMICGDGISRYKIYLLSGYCMVFDTSKRGGEYNFNKHFINIRIQNIKHLLKFI